MRARSRSAAIMSRPPEAFAPKIYYFHPLIAGPPASWLAHLARCRDLGFSHVLSAPLFTPGGDGNLLLSADHDRTNPAIDNSLSADELIGQFSQACREQGLNLLLDVVLGSVAADGRLVKSTPEWFRIASRPSSPMDPRSAGLLPSLPSEVGRGDLRCAERRDLTGRSFCARGAADDRRRSGRVGDIRAQRRR